MIYFSHDLTIFLVGMACFVAGLGAYQVTHHLLTLVRSRRSGFSLPKGMMDGLDLLIDYTEGLESITSKDGEYILGMIVRLVGDREVPPDVQSALRDAGWTTIPFLKHWMYDCTIDR